MKVKIWELKEETEFELELAENTTVDLLKRQVATHCGCQEEQVILLVQGRALVDSTASLRAEGVLDYDRLHLIIRVAEAPPQASKSSVPAVQGATVPKAAFQPAAARAPIPYTPSFPSKTGIPSTSLAKPGLERSGSSAGNPWKLGQSTSSERPPIPKTEVKLTPRVTPVNAGISEGVRPQSTVLKAAPMPSPGFSSPESVAILTELGYSAAEAEKALQMAKGDVDQAANILSGDLQPGGTEDTSAYLRQLAVLAREQPAQFDEMLRNTPQLAQLDAQFPGGFKNALLSGALESRMGSAPDPNAPLTPTDESNIQKLVDMGFPAERAKAAYLACHRNTDMATEALLSSN